jgi:hypothetical protein
MTVTKFAKTDTHGQRLLLPFRPHTLFYSVELVLLDQAAWARSLPQQLRCSVRLMLAVMLPLMLHCLHCGSVYVCG